MCCRRVRPRTTARCPVVHDLGSLSTGAVAGLRAGELARERARVVVDALAREPFRVWIPGEMDDDVELGGAAGPGLTLPRSALRAAHRRDLDDALRADDDVPEVEPRVGESGEEARVEGARAGVPYPALASRDDLVHAVLGQRGDQPREVAAILSLRVRDPETPDPPVDFRSNFPAETPPDR